MHLGYFCHLYRIRLSNGFLNLNDEATSKSRIYSPNTLGGWYSSHEVISIVYLEETLSHLVQFPHSEEEQTAGLRSWILCPRIYNCVRNDEKLVFPHYVARVFKPPIGCARQYCHNSFKSLLYNNWLLILLEFSSVLNIHGKDWCWNSNTLATWWEELTHWKGLWCWERLKAGEEGGDRGWDGWMASPTRWTWVWASSGSWWWTGKPGMLQSMGSQSRTLLSKWTELACYLRSQVLAAFTLKSIISVN